MGDLATGKLQRAEKFSRFHLNVEFYRVTTSAEGALISQLLRNFMSEKQAERQTIKAAPNRLELHE